MRIILRQWKNMQNFDLGYTVLYKKILMKMHTIKWGVLFWKQGDIRFLFYFAAFTLYLPYHPIMLSRTFKYLKDLKDIQKYKET